MLRLLLILCLICSSAGLQILSQQYQVKTISTDGWNRVSVVLFQVEFDAPLAVGNLSLTSFNTTNTSSFVDLSMFDVSLPLNMATASLLGIPSLRCPWNYSFSSIPINSTVTEAQVIPVASTADPVVGFFNSLDVQGATNFVAPMTVLERWFSAIFVLEDRRNCDAFAGCTFDTSGFGPILTDVNFSECTLTFNEGWSQQTNDTAFFLHAVGNESDAFVNQSVTNFTAKELNDCNIAELEAAMGNFESATHSISGSTFEDLSASFWRAMMFGMADPVLSCQLMMSDLLNETTFHGEAPSDRCLVLDPTNSSDPCCNKSLRFTSECCSERQTAYSFPSATVATTARQQLKDGQCKQRRLLLQSLQDFLISDVDNLNPATGCAATAQAIASQSVFDGYYSFVADCRNTVEVAMEPCTQGSDCISGQCFSYQCLPDYDSGFGGDAHTRCFAETMPEQVAAIAKVYLGIPGANQSTFVQQMEAQLWDYECNSYWLRSLLAYPNASTDFGFSVLAITEEQCDTFIVSCAYSNAIYLPSTCLNPPTWAVSNSSLQAGDAGICALCQGETCVPLLYGPRCAYEVFDYFSCIILGGVWDADFASDLPCTVPGIDNEADCLPVEFCPPQSDETGPFYQQVRCQDSYCISTAATNEADCASLATDQVHTIWNTSINNGTCITSEDSATCAAVGNVYWKGRVWRAALYNTPESCTAGACGINGIFNFGTDGANCVDYACTQKCSYCGASVSNSNFCFNSSISSSAACNTAGGTWAAEAFCYVSNQTEAGCLAAGLDWFDCRSIDNPDECAACTTPNCLALQCSWQYSVTCNDEEECVKYGGYCNDAGILSSLTSCPNETNPRAICASTCVIPPTLDAAGDPQCLLGLRAKIGCVDLDGTTPEACKQRGGQIYNRAWNEESCLASGHGCSEEEFSDFYTQKNESQCTDCSGSWGPVFEWTPGQWRLETGYPFEWRPVEMVPYLHWQRMMNYTKLEEAVSAAAVLRTTLSLRSEAECLLNPLLSTLRLLACSCGNNSLADDTLYCQTVANQVREIDLGSSLICSGISGSMRNGGFLISYNNNTIAQSYGCLEIEISSIPVVQFATKRQTPLSSLSLNNVGVHLSDNPYAVLVNQHGRQIGQLISNGIDFKFLELDTTAPAQHKSGNSTNSTLANSNTTLTNSTPPITVNGLVVCFEQSTNVQHDQLFPVLDLAYLNGDSWDLIGANVSLMTDDSNRTYYCTTLSKGGQFAPVYRLNSTDLGAQLFSSVERGFILTLAGLFLFGFLLCTILVLLLLYIHGFKGFFRNLIFGKQLATMILVLLLLFSGIRGVWLLLVGTGVDNGNSEVAVDTVLTSLPIYIFFTLFTLLISFWASLWHEQFRLKKTALGRMKIPFLLINLAIYIFFTIIVVVYLRTDSSTNSDVNIIFQCTVAGIGFTILVLFLLYGILMFVTSYKLLNRAQTQSNAFFFRMTAVTLTCSLASLVQFIFLLLFTFNGFQKVFEALIYFFIVEVIPFYILLYLFFQPTKLSTTLKATYNRSSSMRSLPKLFSFKSTQRETVETTDPRTNTHTSEHE